MWTSAGASCAGVREGLCAADPTLCVNFICISLVALVFQLVPLLFHVSIFSLKFLLTFLHIFLFYPILSLEYIIVFNYILVFFIGAYIHAFILNTGKTFLLKIFLI